MSYLHYFLLQSNADIGTDVVLFGVPIAVVIMLLVQLCKMLRMPSEWSPWASLVIGLLTASAVQATKPDITFSASTVVYTVLLAVNYTLMANGIWAIVVGTQDTIRARSAPVVQATVSVPPQQVSAQTDIVAGGVHFIGSPK